jgi:Tol biopolymer transport system component
LQQVELPSQVVAGVGRQWVSYIAVNDTRPTGTPGTPQPQNNSESVYISSADAGTRLKVLDLPASTDRRIYWSPNGAYMAYLIVEGDAQGLYVLDVRGATTQRLFAMRDFTPRGFPIQPVWSNDSKRLILMLPTAYDFDIYSIKPDGTDLQDLTESGSYELWPALSPDGAYLAFVSDRGSCSSWRPDAASTCYTPDAKTPEGGALYVMDMASKQVRQLSDQFVNVAPRWITNTRVAFTTSSSSDITATTSLWWADLRGGAAQRVSGAIDPNNPVSASNDAWSPDGDRVVYQESDSSTRLIIRDEKGELLGKNIELNFPRYLFQATWTADGQKVILGGRNGQCPFGMLVADFTLKLLTNVQSGPGVCEPTFSPDGRYIAYAGTSRGTGTARDGRIDIYVSEANGLGARLLSSRLSGQLKLLGWIRGGS